LCFIDKKKGVNFIFKKQDTLIDDFILDIYLPLKMYVVKMYIVCIIAVFYNCNLLQILL